MNARAAAVSGVLALTPALVGAGGPAPKPPDTVVVDPGSGSIEMWPYTGTDFSGSPSDPVNLFFMNADPRAVRQALLGLDGDRPPGQDLPPPFGGCTWADGMGYEQTSWAETERWVGSEVQLVCIHPGAPLGDPFRVHLRLFRQGVHTIGAAHFEFLIPRTAEHEVLSWEFARLFVLGDAARTGLLAALPSTVPLVGPGYFRSVRFPVFQGLVDQGAADLLAALGLSTAVVDESGNPKIPTSGVASVLTLMPGFEPMRERVDSQTAVEYDVVAPKPFCAAGPYDFVRLEGRVGLSLHVSTDTDGRHLRRFQIEGALKVTPWDPIGNQPVGDSSPAHVRERHSALLTDHHGQVYERVSQRLLGLEQQSLAWSLAAGDVDSYAVDVQCGP